MILRLLFGSLLVGAFLATGEGCGVQGRLDGAGHGSWHWPWERNQPGPPPAAPPPAGSPTGADG